MPHKDPERRKAYNAAWRKANRKRKKAYAKAYYRENYERIKASYIAWARANPERKKATYTAWAKANPKLVYARNVRWRKRNPEKLKAQQKVHYAVATGKLKRQPCEMCGNPKSEAHHEDYSKPLVVRHLCHLEHMKQHRKENQIQ